MSRARVFYICSLSNKQRCAFVFLGVGLGSWPCMHVAGGELIIIEQAIHNIILAVAIVKRRTYTSRSAPAGQTDKI